MNKFVRKFVLLPFIFLVFLFHVGLIVGCTCGTPRAGQKIEIIIKGENGRVEMRNYQMFQKFFLDVNAKWFWRTDIKEAPLIKQIRQSPPDVEPKTKTVKDFTNDYFSSSNNYFRYLLVRTQLKNTEGKMPELFDNNKIKDTIEKLFVSAYFYLVDADQYWQMDIVFSRITTITANNSTQITDFDLTKTQLKVTKLDYLTSDQVTTKLK